ncbi:hypothetical protein MKX01_028905 [Papaver californicum]|nr:hypothetical protein MKX01_028905 [Papaver californicum]
MVFVTNTPLYDDCGSIIGITCVSFDVQSFLQLPPLPSSEAYSSFIPPTSGPTSKPGHDSQQPLEVVVTASGACTLKGEFVVKIGKQITWQCKGSQHDGLVARNAHGSFTWTKNEQEDDVDQPKSPGSYEKPEMQLLGSNRFGNQASGLRSSSNATNKSSVSSSTNTGSSPLCKFDRETDSLHYDISWEELTIFEQICKKKMENARGIITARHRGGGHKRLYLIYNCRLTVSGSCGTVYHGQWCGSVCSLFLMKLHLPGDVALKVFSKFEYSDDLLHSFRQEVLLMKALRHPNVLLFMGAVTLPEHLCIVMEFLPPFIFHFIF